MTSLIAFGNNLPNAPSQHPDHPTTSSSPRLEELTRNSLGITLALTVYDFVPEHLASVKCIAIDRENTIMSCPVKNEGRPECELMRLSSGIRLKSTQHHESVNPRVKIVSDNEAVWVWE